MKNAAPSRGVVAIALAAGAAATLDSRAATAAVQVGIGDASKRVLVPAGRFGASPSRRATTRTCSRACSPFPLEYRFVCLHRDRSKGIVSRVLDALRSAEYCETAEVRPGQGLVRVGLAGKPWAVGLNVPGFHSESVDLGDAGSSLEASSRESGVTVTVVVEPAPDAPPLLRPRRMLDRGASGEGPLRTRGPGAVRCDRRLDPARECRRGLRRGVGRPEVRAASLIPV